MLTLIADSREQSPYEFKIPCETGTLTTGDYSIKGCEHLVAIERKSLEDLMGTLTKGRERFEKELARGRGLDYFALVVESSLTLIAMGAYRSNMTPKAAIQSLLAFSVRYNLPVFFVDSREFGARVTESLLLKWATEQERKLKAIAA